MEQSKLTRLLISEISGVDDPANQLPGWVVTKSKPGGEQDLTGEAARVQLVNRVKSEIASWLTLLQTLQRGVEHDPQEFLDAEDALAKCVRQLRELGLDERGQPLDKAKHDGRRSATSGKFNPMSSALESKGPLGPVQHFGAVHPVLAAQAGVSADAGRRVPSGGGDPDGGHMAYDGSPGDGHGAGEGDPQGFRRQTDDMLNVTGHPSAPSSTDIRVT